jgi:hypothetical protein
MDLALFDFDGTITTADTFAGFLRFAVRPGRMAVGVVLLSPVIVGYRLKESRRAVHDRLSRESASGASAPIRFVLSGVCMRATCFRSCFGRSPWNASAGISSAAIPS